MNGIEWLTNLLLNPYHNPRSLPQPASQPGSCRPGHRTAPLRRAAPRLNEDLEHVFLALAPSAEIAERCEAVPSAPWDGTGRHSPPAMINFKGDFCGLWWLIVVYGWLIVVNYGWLIVVNSG